MDERRLCAQPEDEREEERLPPPGSWPMPRPPRRRRRRIGWSGRRWRSPMFIVARIARTPYDRAKTARPDARRGSRGGGSARRDRREPERAEKELGKRGLDEERDRKVHRPSRPDLAAEVGGARVRHLLEQHDAVDPSFRQDAVPPGPPREARCGPRVGNAAGILEDGLPGLLVARHGGDPGLKRDVHTRLRGARPAEGREPKAVARPDRPPCDEAADGGDAGERDDAYAARDGRENTHREKGREHDRPRVLREDERAIRSTAAAARRPGESRAPRRANATSTARKRRAAGRSVVTRCPCARSDGDSDATASATSPASEPKSPRAAARTRTRSARSRATIMSRPSVSSGSRGIASRRERRGPRQRTRRS